MAERSLIPPLTDIVEAIERIRGVLGDTSLDAFEADWQKQWLIERGVEIVSEASRHLTVELKARNPNIPWNKVAGIGNVLRHDYGNIAAPIIWNSSATIYRRWSASVAPNLPPQSPGRYERRHGSLKPQPLRLRALRSGWLAEP